MAFSNTTVAAQMDLIPLIDNFKTVHSDFLVILLISESKLKNKKKYIMMPSKLLYPPGSIRWILWISLCYTAAAAVCREISPLPL